MAISGHNSLNPNADPFLYRPTSFPPTKKEPISIPIPIFNLSHQFCQWKTQWPPVHGYVYYVEPTSRWQYHHTMNPQTWWSSSGFSGDISPPENSVGSDLRGFAKMEPMKHTTVMIRNIPNQFRRHDLLSILDEHCKSENRSCDGCWSEYDFVYLPMDFRRFWYGRKVSNLGYAFVNFTTAAAAAKFCTVYHGREWDVTLNKKVCEVNRAKIQGMKALKEAFRNKIFWCHTNQYLPVKLDPPSDGCRRYRAISVGKRIPYIPPKPLKKCC